LRLAAALLVLLVTSSGRAENGPVVPMVTNDGLWLTLGPVGGATRIGGGWYSAFGLEASVVRLTEGQLPALIGAAFGGVSYAGREGGRYWLEGEAAIRDPLPVAVGLGIGPCAEIGRSIPTRLGVQGTLWFFAGVVPYVRAGTIAETGGFVEVGIMIKVPAVRFP
jgi:hypothetical protein